MEAIRWKVAYFVDLSACWMEMQARPPFAASVEEHHGSYFADLWRGVDEEAIRLGPFRRLADAAEVAAELLVAALFEAGREEEACSVVFSLPDGVLAFSDPFDRGWIRETKVAAVTGTDGDSVFWVSDGLPLEVRMVQKADVDEAFEASSKILGGTLVPPSSIARGA